MGCLHIAVNQYGLKETTLHGNSMVKGMMFPWTSPYGILT